jgi:hypothetical protein
MESEIGKLNRQIEEKKQVLSKREDEVQVLGGRIQD